MVAVATHQRTTNAPTHQAILLLPLSKHDRYSRCAVGTDPATQLDGGQVLKRFAWLKLKFAHFSIAPSTSHHSDLHTYAMYIHRTLPFSIYILWSIYTYIYIHGCLGCHILTYSQLATHVQAKGFVWLSATTQRPGQNRRCLMQLCPTPTLSLIRLATASRCGGMIHTTVLTMSTAGRTAAAAPTTCILITGGWQRQFQSRMLAWHTRFGAPQME